MKFYIYFIALLAVLPSITSGVQIDDFDKLVRDFGNEWVKKRNPNNHVAWSDAYMKNKNLVDIPSMSHCKINVITDKMNYGAPAKPIKIPNSVHSDIYYNGGSRNITEELIREIKTESVVSFSMSKKLHIGVEASLKAGFPGVADFNFKHSLNVDLASDKEDSDVVIETDRKKGLITIPAKKILVSDLVVTEQEVSVPWFADVFITGYVAISYEHEVDEGQWLYCYPVKELASAKFLYSERHDALLYKATGMFNSIRGTDANLDVKEYELGTYKHTKREQEPQPTKHYTIKLMSI